MTDRVPWFRCNPTKLLGALSGMEPDSGYLYTIILMRVYEVGGPIDDDEGVLARRTGYTPRRVAAALRWLIERGKVQRLDGGLLDSDTTHEELAAREKLLIDTSRAGKESAKRKGEFQSKKDKQKQGLASTNVERPLSDWGTPEERSSTDRDRDKDREVESREEVKEATASSSTVVDLKAAKALAKSEGDQKLLDRITDCWNAWAASHGSPQVRYLTGQRSIHCRRRINDLLCGAPIEEAETAFSRLLNACEQSFFVRGNPRSPLKFDQIMNEGFMVKMMEGGFAYVPERKRSWRA